MALHLITGHKGSAHITSADQGAYNMATFGDGNIVFKRGQEFKATTKSNNTVNIAEGEAMIQGRYIKMPIGTTEDVTITNGTQGKYRSDLICIRYESSSGIESARLVVIKGAESNSNPAPDPSYIKGNITDGTATVADFPLYRVRLNGISLGTPEKLFTAVDSMADYMAHYQMPTASKDQLGAVKIGSGINVNNGVISASELLYAEEDIEYADWVCGAKNVAEFGVRIELPFGYRIINATAEVFKKNSGGYTNIFQQMTVFKYATYFQNNTATLYFTNYNNSSESVSISYIRLRYTAVKTLQ